MASEDVGLSPTFDQTAGEIPEVKEMLQKGEGLSTLKKSLSLFRSLPAGSPSIALNSPEEIEHSQRRLERDTLEASIDRWRLEGEHLKSIGINTGLTNSTVGSMMWEWHSKLVPLIEEDIRKSHELEEKTTRSLKDEEFLLWAPFLQTLSPEKLSAATILTAVAACCTDRLDERGCTLHHIVSRIGNAVQDEFYAQTIRDDKEHAKWRNILKLIKSTRRYGSLAKMVHQTVAESEEQLEWYKETRIRLGAGLLARLMETAKVQVTREDPVTKAEVRDLQPVFFHGFQYMKGKRVGVVLFNSEIFQQFVNKPVNSALAKHLPMISKPRPWVGWREGGYLDHSVSVIRIDRNEDQARRYAITACENGDLSQIFAGLDVLGQTAWRINRFVFETMLSIWNTGKGFAKIPPEEVAEAPPTPPTSEDPRERAIFKRRQLEYNNYKSGLKSQRCYQNFQLEVARSYLNQTMYFPHNIDFRGRAYPGPPFLNHMGADNCRGLLLFAEGRELGAQGLWWLKVHLANVYGYDKASFDDRLKFTEAHLIEIYDSVDNPLGGSKWWLGAEDPWQCLAACKELKSALQLPDPTRYVCQLPIHQDGTCNGLQHYAALGGDISGAQQVNLEPGPRPSDIYTGVAEIVKADIAKDATNGNELAKYLDGKITRKIVKQTVMTNVYGVTFIGAKRQVLRQLEDLFPDFPDTTAINRHAAAIYIARGIFKALGNLFNGAHDIQYWLTDAAARISESISPEQVAYLCKDGESQKSQSQFKVTVRKAKGDPIAAFKSAVIWTTPLKLPVVQPYRKADARRINTSLQSIAIRDATSSNPVDKAKQVQAFPPNFIHSLDATHMFLTALKCHEIGISFASIHDSFWTHAGDVDTMNKVIREAFIRMHSEDIIGRLAAEFRARYGNNMHLASVPADSQLGRDILAWRINTRGGSRNTSLHRKIDAQKVDELKLEQRRLTLLASSDPKEREEGESLVTAAKMFEQPADEETLTPTDMPTTTLGGMKRSTSDYSSRSAKLKANKQLEVGDLENAETIEPAALDMEDDLDDDLSTHADDEGSPGVEDAMDDGDADSELAAERKAPVAKGNRGRKKKSNVNRNQKLWLWLPLKFAPVPRKVGSPNLTRKQLKSRSNNWLREISMSLGLRTASISSRENSTHPCTFDRSTASIGRHYCYIEFLCIAWDGVLYVALIWASLACA